MRKTKNEREPEWNEENMNRNPGDTDFEICGWCRYAGTGRCRHGCNLEASCNLLPDDRTGTYGYKTYYSKEVIRYNDENVSLSGKSDIQDIIQGYNHDINKEYRARIKGLKEEIKILKGGKKFRNVIRHSLRIKKEAPEKVYWDTSCIFRYCTEDFVDNIIKLKNEEIEFFENIIIPKVERRIRELEILLKTADDMPVLPDNRGSEHFNLGDKVMVWYQERRMWKEGIVVYGYRSGDGCVSFHLTDGTCICGSKMDKPGAFKELDEWKRIKDKKMKIKMKKTEKEIGPLAQCGGCGLCVPGVILKSEYDWFKDHTSRWGVWIRMACDKDFNGEEIDPKSFIIPQ